MSMPHQAKGKKQPHFSAGPLRNIGIVEFLAIATRPDASQRSVRLKPLLVQDMAILPGVNFSESVRQVRPVGESARPDADVIHVPSIVERFDV